MSSFEANKGIPRNRIAQCFPDAPADIEERITAYGVQRGLGEYWQQEDLSGLGQIVYQTDKPVLNLPPVEKPYWHLPPCNDAKTPPRPADVVANARTQIEQTRREMSEQLQRAKAERSAAIEQRTRDLLIFKNKAIGLLEGIIQYADFLEHNNSLVMPIRWCHD